MGLTDLPDCNYWSFSTKAQLLLLLTLLLKLKLLTWNKSKKYNVVCEMCANIFPQVVNKSRQWWTVRNNRDEEGYVPPNVLEPMNKEEPAVSSFRFPLFLKHLLLY